MTDAVFKKNKLTIIAMVVLSVLTAAMFVIPVSSVEAAASLNNNSQAENQEAELISEETPEDGSGVILSQLYRVTIGETYFLTFSHKAYASGDEMNVFFQPEGETSAALATVRSSSDEWTESVYEVVAEAEVMELSFETISAQSGDIAEGPMVYSPQLRTISNIDIGMKVVSESTSETQPYVRERNRYVKYRVTLTNTGGTTANNVRVEIPLVSGLADTTYKVTDARTNWPITHKLSDDTIHFQAGSNTSATGWDGGTIEVGETYEYFVEFKVSGRNINASGYISAGTNVNLVGKVFFKDTVEYSNVSDAASFTYGERGVSGKIYRDRNGNNKYDSSVDTLVTSTDSSIGVMLVDSSGNVVNDADGNPFFQTMESYHNGEYEFIGVPAGKYQVWFTNMPALMPSEISSDAEGNKADMTPDRKYAKIDVDMTSTGMHTNQYIGLVRSYSMAMAVSVNGGAPVTTDMSNTAVVDYNDTVETTFIVTTLGYHIETPVKIRMLISAGTELLSNTAGATITPTSSGGYELVWDLSTMNGLGTIHEFSVKYLVRMPTGFSFYDTAYITVPFETGMINAYLVVSQNTGRLTLGKGIGELRESDKLTRDEEFLFRLDYRLNYGQPILYSFYTNLDLKKDTNYRSTRLTKLEPGVYTITELDTNWRFDLYGPSLESYDLLILPNRDGQVRFDNYQSNDKWVDGKTNVTNIMQQLTP